MDVLAPESVGCRNAISKELNTLAYYDPSKDYSYPPSECLNKGYRSYSTSREEAYCICSKAVTVGVKSVKDFTNLMNVDIDVDAESPYANSKTC